MTLSNTTWYKIKYLKGKKYSAVLESHEVPCWSEKKPKKERHRIILFCVQMGSMLSRNNCMLFCIFVLLSHSTFSFVLLLLWVNNAMRFNIQFMLVIKNSDYVNQPGHFSCTFFSFISLRPLFCFHPSFPSLSFL